MEEEGCLPKLPPGLYLGQLPQPYHTDLETPIVSGYKLEREEYRLKTTTLDGKGNRVYVAMTTNTTYFFCPSQ